jgi:predicted enzyme related to lactoylglutathione lyase
MGQQVGPVYLGFDQVENAHATGAPPELGVSLWFTVEDIQATYDRLVALGARVRYPPTKKPHAGYLASVYDLDGNILGLAQRQPEK